MSRRPKPAEMEFGSDSFLDVLANMVGILIILIVIAGVRVGRAPVPSLADIQALESAPPAEPAGDVVPPLPEPYIPAPQPVTEADVAAAPPPEPKVLEPDEPPPTIARQLAACGSEAEALRQAERQLAAALSLARTEEQAARQQAVASEQTVTSQANEVHRLQVQLAGLQQNLAQTHGALSGLLAQYEEAKQAKPSTKELRHKLTPLAQTVHGDELHFRLENNRVSYVPVDQLVRRLKTQIERQKEYLARFRKHTGVVGPVDGYSMHYLIERQSLSPLEEMKLGSHVFRVGVSRWEIIAEPELVTETAEEAVQPGSRFAIALAAASHRASLTFWVYPDSFSLFRQLQSVAHAEGFTVSARPIPVGKAIAGSPNGSRSVGQ